MNYGRITVFIGIIWSIIGNFFEHCSQAKLIGEKLSIIGQGLLKV